MTRTIKFRGLRADGMGWSYGDLHHVNGEVYVHPTEEPEIYESPEAYEVRPATVGQFTGMTDRNGKEIWEGDVFEGGVGDYTLSIEWDTEQAAWGLRFSLPECEPEISRGFCVTDYIDIDTMVFTMEVIGNIHETKNA